MLVCMLTLSGSMISSFFLVSQTLIYDFTSANFTAKLNKFVMFSLIIPYFLPWSIWDQSAKILLEYDLIVTLEEGTLKDAVYTLREAVHFADVIQILWLCGMVVYLIFHCHSNIIHSRMFECLFLYFFTKESLYKHESNFMR